MHGRDATVLNDLLWFNIMHYPSFFQCFFFNLLWSLTCTYKIIHHHVCVWEIQHEGTCKMVNIVWNKAKCCIYFAVFLHTQCFKCQNILSLVTISMPADLHGYMRIPTTYYSFYDGLLYDANLVMIAGWRLQRFGDNKWMHWRLSMLSMWTELRNVCNNGQAG